MFRTWFTATAAAVMVTATMLTGPTAQASDTRHTYGPAQLQHDLDAIRDTGISGVLAEVNIGPRRLRGISGVADIVARGPVNMDGYFRMGSNTKTFVSVVVLQLVAEGRLSLDDTVERWLPGVVTGNGNNGTAVTVRQLLQHTSGIYDYANDLVARITSVETYQKFRFESFTPDQLVAMAMAHEPDFAPGQSWSYSNTNYALIGMIIGKVTGRDWASQVRDRIIRPLGLRHTFAPAADTDLPDPHASAYLYLDRNTSIETADANLTWAGAAGALVTTAADLSRFWDAIGRGTLLRPAQQKEMRTTVLATTFQGDRPGLRYGLGLQWAPLSCGGGYWSHDGDVPGFSTRTGVSADGRDTVVISISTSADTPVDQAAWAMIDHVFCSRD
jgi:D-alanyl-D-alanine carboxypeptidase